MDQAARQGDPSVYKLPRPKVEGSPYDFSFSGLKTAVVNLLHNASQKGETVEINNLAASFQQAVVEIPVQPLSGGGRAVRIQKAGHRRRGVGQFRVAEKNGG